jgi:hypothetical protein
MSSKTKVAVNKYGITKTLYLNRGGKTEKQINEILLLEVKEHIRSFPDVIFDKVKDPIYNKDGSKSYFIIFKPKPNAVIPGPSTV